MDRREKGAHSEEAAARYLEEKGYRILQRNFRWKGGEIDIVAGKKDLIVFVEVRARASPEFGRAAETVNWSKREKLKRTALLYLQKNRLDRPTRFDVIAFDGENMTHIENAFD
jgi:putative endonuclease